MPMEPQMITILAHCGLWVGRKNLTRAQLKTAKHVVNKINVMLFRTTIEAPIRIVFRSVQEIFITVDMKDTRVGISHTFSHFRHSGALAVFYLLGRFH